MLENHRDQVVVDIYKQDEFFGEAAFLQHGHGGEEATALEDTKLMSWTSAELQAIIVDRPPLAMAFLQILAQRTMDFTYRIESFFVDTIDRRLARALIRFSERLGTETGPGDGAFRMPPFTHELLAQYVGTSRELITTYMNQFRREGYLKFSRKEVILFRDPLREWIRARSSLNLFSAKSNRDLSSPAE
jgi:CRP/FNR family transcriptional regulator